MITALSHRLFLDPAMAEFVVGCRVAHPKVFSLAERINEYANREVFSWELDRDSAQELLLASLLHRALTAFQGVVLLAERGMPSEVRLLVRKVLEVTFRIVAIAKDAEVGQAYMLEDEVHRRKFINKLKMLSEPVRAPLENSGRDAELKALQDRIAVQGIRERSTQWYAERAGLQDFYHSAYSKLSESVHANVRDLDSTLNVDEKGILVGLNYGPSDEDVELNIRTASEAVIFSLRAVFSVLMARAPGELESLHAEFNALHAELAK